MNIEELNKPLSASVVKSRNQAGTPVSYIEGWHVIAEANRIFGFDGWDRATVSVEPVQNQQIGDKHRVSYTARVRVLVRHESGEIIREGCGFGQGISKDLGQAHESAIKEAETDAMKRALMTFGNPFGLALYDKAKAGVESEQDAHRERYMKEAFAFVDAAKTKEECSSWWVGESIARRDMGLTQADVDELKGRMLKRFPAEKQSTQEQAA